MKTDLEKFLYVCHDPKIQLGINKNLAEYSLLAEHVKDNNLIQFYHNKTKKILMIKPRETLFLKVVKKVDSKTYLSLNKSIVLKEPEEGGQKKAKDGEFERSNIRLSVYKYNIQSKEGEDEVKTYKTYQREGSKALYV